MKKAAIGANVLLLLITAGLLGSVLLEKPSGTSRVSSMDGYVSRYNPGHISSGEAWELTQTNNKAIILDVRTEASYNDRHISGAINVPFDKLESYAADNLHDKNSIIICYCFCGDKGGAALSAYNKLTGLGYANVSYTEPEDEWTYVGLLVSQSEINNIHRIITGDEAKAIYDSNPGAILLDVRNPDEFDTKHISGSILIPVAELESRLSELPDKKAIIIVYCRAGVRSGSAYEILLSAGYTNVYDMQKIDNWPMSFQ